MHFLLTHGLYSIRRTTALVFRVREDLTGCTSVMHVPSFCRGRQIHTANLLVLYSSALKVVDPQSSHRYPLPNGCCNRSHPSEAPLALSQGPENI
jgi:hypothetical protein